MKETRLKIPQMVSEKSFVLFEIRKPVRKPDRRSVRKSVRERETSQMRD